MKIRNRLRDLTLASLFLLTTLVAGSWLSSLSPSHGLAPLAEQAVAAYSDQGSAQAPLSYAPIIRGVQPAVVSIVATKTVQMQTGQIPMDNSFLRRFFGDAFPQLPAPQPQMGQGSGVIIDSDGYILTNHHVVDGANRIDVVLSDRRRFEAEVKGQDPKSDLALLKIDAEGLPMLALADSSQMQVGDVVFAVGYPFGVGQTVTMGIVSATSRGNLGIEDYEDFIQTDAAINPGNSGGALVDSRGQLVGINTAIIARSGGNEGIGFAIPANMARPVAEQLRRSGKVSRGLLGAIIQDLTPELGQAFGIDGRSGALVSDLTPDGPGALAGLERGDIVTRFNGRDVPDSRRLRLWVAETAPGTTVHLTLLRHSREVELSVKLGELEAESSSAAPGQSESDQEWMGLSLQELTPALQRSLGLPGGLQGVVISQVAPQSPAARAGLQEGDVILEINRQAVSRVSQARRLLAKGALLLVQRGGNSFFTVLN